MGAVFAWQELLTSAAADQICKEEREPGRPGVRTSQRENMAGSGLMHTVVAGARRDAMTEI